MMISIKGIVAFAPNIGVMITKDAYTVDADELKQLVMIAQRHIGDAILEECCCGGRGPLSHWPHWEMDFDSYLDFLAKYEQSTASRRLKRKAVK